ncbi:MAG TPA: MFS transporter [Thermoanaerobaculia bacterium]|nr:MFS transporter [Thermoanaerobaculia bacterium]
MAAPDPSAPRFDPQRRRAVTAALMLVTALASFETTVVSTAMPTIIGDLGGLPLYAWVFAVYLLTSTVAMPVYGRLADIYGRRRLILTAIAVFLAGAIVCASARSMPQLIAARAIQGLGAAGLIPVALTVVADLYSLEERARIQGLFSGIWGFASLVGPLLGAFLTVHFGWRSIFTINIPLGILAFILVGVRMRESRSPRPDPVDVAGAATLALGITLLLFSVLRAPGTSGAGLAIRVLLAAAGGASLAVFARLQAKRRHPLVPPELFRHWDTASPYLAGIILGTTIFGIDTFVPLFVQGARGGTAGAAGAVITPLVFFWAVSATVAGRLILRFGFRRTARFGAVLVLVGLAGLVAAALANAGVAWASAACAVVGAGLGPSSMSQVLAIQHVVPERHRGVSTSLVPFFRTAGGSLGVGALGGVFTAGAAARLGGNLEVASRLLAGAHGAEEAKAAGIAPELFRVAIERSLLPVFAVILGLAVVNLFFSARFPESPTGKEDEPSTPDALAPPLTS